MIWLLAGIIPPILWALVNHTDKYLLSKTKHKSSVDVLMVYSTGFSLIVLPFLFYFARTELFLDWRQIAVQIIGGVLMTLSIYFGLIALSKDEASVVMPLVLMVPIFGYFFSYVLLGETLNFKQIVACLLIVIGALILSLEFGEEQKLRIKHGVLGLMVLSTVFQAAQETLFKIVTIDNSFAVSLFWMHVGIITTGLLIVFLRFGVWIGFIESIKTNGKLIFGVNFVSEAVSSVAYMVRDYSTLLAPIAIIMSLNGYQPVFVFILGIILTIFAPKFASEKIKPIHLIHKGASILIILVGTIMIAQTM